MTETGSATAVCQTCGMPVRVIFKDGKIDRVLAVCGHVQSKPASDEGHDD